MKPSNNNILFKCWNNTALLIYFTINNHYVLFNYFLLAFTFLYLLVGYVLLCNTEKEVNNNSILLILITSHH